MTAPKVLWDATLQIENTSFSVACLATTKKGMWWPEWLTILKLGLTVLLGENFDQVFDFTNFSFAWLGTF